MEPIGLLLRGSLRYLGRGWAFDDLEESTGMPEEVHRNFINIFIKYGRNVLYPCYYVKYPNNAEEAKTHMHEFNIAGLVGALGSIDACHVLIETCSHRMKQIWVGNQNRQPDLSI